MKRLVAIVTVALCALGAAPQRRPTVWLIGDSTMAERVDTTRTWERGWGQMLARFLDDRVVVRDVAVNGRSTKSFIAERKWAAVDSALRPGDYVLIQFGHNDQKVDDSTRFTNPNTGYRRNLTRFVADARAKGATPILLTPIARRKFNEKGSLVDTHGAYTGVVHDVARDNRVPLIDLELLTEDLIAAAGPEGSKALFVWVAAGVTPLYPDGRQDDTHLNGRGAIVVARLAARALKASRLPLARHVVRLDD